MYKECFTPARFWTRLSLYLVSHPQQAPNLKPCDRFILLATRADLHNHHVGHLAIMGAEAADGSIRLSSRLVRNTVGVLEVAVGGGCIEPPSSSCQSTWWMNQFHINLMPNSFNWIIYTAQRHMGSHRLNPRWRWTCAPGPLDSDPQSITSCSAG